MAALKDVGVEIARETRMNLTDIIPDSVVHSFAIYIISLSFIGETTENAAAEFSTCTGPRALGVRAHSSAQPWHIVIKWPKPW